MAVKDKAEAAGRANKSANHKNTGRNSSSGRRPRTLVTNTSDNKIKLFGKRVTKGVGVTKLKQKLHNLTRYMKGVAKGKFTPSDADLAAKKAELAALEKELEEAKDANKRIAKNNRFDKVKMIEKMKLHRIVTQCTKKLANLLVDPNMPPTKEEVELRQTLADAEEKIIYVRTFPPTETYISINKDCQGAALERRTAIHQSLLAKLGYKRPVYRMSETWNGEGQGERDADSVQSRQKMVEGDGDDDDDFFGDDNEESSGDEQE